MKLQFSLRTLLIFVAVFVLASGSLIVVYRFVDATITHVERDAARERVLKTGVASTYDRSLLGTEVESLKARHDAEQRRFSIAVDPKASIDERIDAARKLSPDEQATLRVELIKQLPGELDVFTFNTVSLLGEIGDESTVASLESFWRMPLEIPGKIGTAVHSAIAKIQKRQAEQDVR